MSKHFNLLEFIGQAPKPLLQAYCAKRGLLHGFDWGTKKKVDREQLAQALTEAGPTTYERVAVDFRAIWDLHGVGFTRGILNEARQHGDVEAYTILGGLTHLGKALWATLERPDWAANAKILSDVDKLPAGAWVKRGGLPRRAIEVDPSTVDRLENDLIDFFTRVEHRGRNCKIDCLRRGSEEVYFTWAEDHAESDLLWHQGQLRPQTLNRSFRLIFKHNDERRTLDVYFEGNRDLVPDLQVIFSRAVIGDAIDRDTPDEQSVYAIDQVLEPGFEFIYPPGLGIADVRVIKMRFYLEGWPWRRFLAEADTTKDRAALEDFVRQLKVDLPQSRLVLDQVCINASFHKRDNDRRARSRSFYITHPDSLRLKKDDLGEAIEQMLLMSGIERPFEGER